MSWTRYLVSKDVQKHVTSRQELDSWRSLITRDLGDASIPGLSADRRFATAYNAALQAASMAIACAGYRITAKTGHHKLAFECAALVLGKQARNWVDYLETCRRKRNQIDYTHSNVATETEAEEIIAKAREFYDFVEAWIVKKHPRLAR